MRIGLGRLRFLPSNKDVASVMRSYAKRYVDMFGSSLRLNKIKKEIESHHKDTKINMKYLLKVIIDYMVIYSIKDTYYVEIPKITVDDFNLDTIARLVTFGNLDVKGDDILVKALEYARDKL